MPREGKLEITTCEQYVLQRLADYEAKCEVLEGRVAALTERLEGYQSPFQTLLQSEGRAALFVDGFSEFAITATDYETFCRQGVLDYSEVVKLIGKDEFFKEFAPELRGRWEKYAAKLDNKDND
jgi:hypothetical protein